MHECLCVGCMGGRNSGMSGVDEAGGGVQDRRGEGAGSGGDRRPDGRGIILQICGRAKCVSL